ncbi:MAG TPA: TolC family protein [Steroidobacteraceae bacterium]|nr:TolC family protein [Steroidobacteraceae bacterium]
MRSFYVARRARAWVLSIILGASPALAAHGADTPLTLDAAVRRGLLQAPLVAARGEDIDAMREQAVRAGRLPDPSLTLGVSNYPVTNPGAFGWRADPMTMRAVGITQAIPSRASRAAERRLAAANIDVAAADRAASEQTVQERIADAWIGVWAYGKQRSLLQQLQDESGLAVRIATARLRGGDGSATDVLAARAETLMLENRLTAAAARLRGAKASLQRWLGARIAALGAAPDFAHLAQNPAEFERSIDVEAPLLVLQARERVAAAALAEARAAKHPNWSVGVSYGNRAPGLSDMVTLEIGVSLPLFGHNRQDRGISAQHAEWRAAQANREDARRAQREAVARALASWQGWGQQIARDRDALLPLARDRARTALAAYRGGAPLEPWLDARRDEIQLRLKYVDALAARAELWASLAYLLPSPQESP